MGSATYMNSLNTLIGVCYDETDEYLQSFVYNLEDDTYTILPGLYDSTNVQALSINDNNQIVGTIYTPDMDIQQRPVYWEKVGDRYEITDLTALIYEPNTNGIPFNATHIFAVKIFNDGNLFLNAYDQESGWHFIGHYYFDSESEIGWRVGQCWFSAYTIFINSASEKYIEISEPEFINNDELYVTSSIYEVTRDEWTPIKFRFTLNDYYESVGYQNILFVSCNDITPNNDVMCLVVTEEEDDLRGFYELTINLDSMEYIDIRKLFDDNLVEIPEGYYFYPSTPGPNGTILGQFRDENWNMYVGRLIPITNETRGYIHTEFDEYERGETFTATYTIENGKPDVMYLLGAETHSGYSEFPEEFYNFDGGSCELAYKEVYTDIWICQFTREIPIIQIPISVTVGNGWEKNISFSLTSSDESVGVSKIITIIPFPQTTGYIYTEYDEYERGEKFTATYTLENAKANKQYELFVKGAKSTFPVDYYNFDDGYCRLIAGIGETTKYWNCYFNKDIPKIEIPIEIDTSDDIFGVNYDYVDLGIYTSDGELSILKRINIVETTIIDEYLAIKTYISEKYNIPIDSLSLESKQYVEWNDGCLGVYTKNEECTQVVTPGYRLIFVTSENITPNRFSIHTNKSMSYWREGNFLPIDGETEVM